MSHISAAQQGLAAVEAKKWDEALPLLSKALQTSPNPAWLIARSKALIGKNRYQEALEDANLAWHTAYERNKRPLLSEANYRRAVAYFRLGQYANADACCVYAIRLIKGFPAIEKEDPLKSHIDADGFYTVTSEDAQRQAREDAEKETPKGGAEKGLNMINGLDLGPKNKEARAASSLRFMILNAMEKLEKEDPARKLTTGARPEQKNLADLEFADKKPTAAPVAKPIIPADTQPQVQDFQSNAVISVSIFSKGVNKEKLQVEYKPFSVHLDAIIYPNGDTRPFDLELWGEIDPEASKHTVTPNKVELSLKKKTPGKWKQLKSDGNKPATPAAAAESLTVSEKAPEQPKAEEKESAKPAESKKTTEAPNAAHQYPSSSRTGPKNWDALDDEEEAEDTSDVNFFFKKLYQGATPEQQRAMMKSFTESNGTSLSTDWNDVRDRTVKTVPPEGVEAKKWSS
ncbi:hypothetical protein CDV31_002837 [Fusarium ambrosium]|nr:hypothetical protein CDV31_002837 [Fusarium ambrosium]